MEFTTDFIKYGAVLLVEDQNLFVKPFSSNEVKQALFDIGSLKSPGPDGFGSSFF